MADSTNLEELKNLYKKMGGTKSKAENIAEAIKEITTVYEGGGSGGASIVSAYLYPDASNVVKGGAIILSNGTSIDMELMYIPELTVTSTAGATSGTTKLTVDNTLAAGHSYRYGFDCSPSKPAIGQDVSNFTPWDGVSDIEAGDGATITLVDVDENNKATKAGLVSAIIKY